MESHYFEDFGCFLRYIDLPGTGTPVVWLHGIVCSSTAELLPVASQPILRDHRSLLVDFLGYGYSDRPEAFGYSIQDHARTIVGLLDGLGIESCHLVGHSFGGTVAIHIASSRPDLVKSVIAAESNIDPGPGGISGPIAAQSEKDFVERGYQELIREHESSAVEDPTGVSARHLGMFRMMSPLAVHRTATSVVTGASPPTRDILKNLQMPRTFVVGEWSEEPEDVDLTRAGVGWDTVPASGHPMGLHNPAGFADVIYKNFPQSV